MSNRGFRFALISLTVGQTWWPTAGIRNAWAVGSFRLSVARWFYAASSLLITHPAWHRLCTPSR